MTYIFTFRKKDLAGDPKMEDEAASPCHILQGIRLLLGSGDDTTRRVSPEKPETRTVGRRARLLHHVAARYGPEIDIWALGVTTYSLHRPQCKLGI